MPIIAEDESTPLSRIEQRSPRRLAMVATFSAVAARACAFRFFPGPPEPLERPSSPESSAICVAISRAAHGHGSLMQTSHLWGHRSDHASTRPLESSSTQRAHFEEQRIPLGLRQKSIAATAGGDQRLAERFALLVPEAFQKL
jgi:hypothetical protein